MSYVLGFFAADGYITINRRGGQFWSIQITDKDLLENIRRVIESNHKIGFRQKVGNSKALYRLQIGSIEMCEDLSKLGFKKRKTKNLSIPNVPEKYFKDFVRGYFDGDGNVWVGYTHKKSKKPLLVIRTVFTSCSLEFLETLRNRLEKVFVDKGVIGKEGGNYHRLTYSVHGSLKLYNFMYNGLESHLFLNRKKVVFDRFVEKRRVAAVAQR
ncbi:MAG: LAGLIDADG family homing endonuclease, partial [bacterium]